MRDEQAKALSNVSVALRKSGDSSLVKLTLTNTSGNYTFADVSAGKYFIEGSHIGYSNLNSAVFEVRAAGDAAGVQVPDLTLAKASEGLKEVVVTSRKPIIEVKADKMILNVEASVNSVGVDALELLRKSPGVMVDKDNNLSLSGKNGVQVYIDGKPTPLTGADLANYLKTIQSSSIEAIEIISNPSAKYDAAGNAGIINIRLKKNKSYGTNGTINAGYDIGIYSKYNAGISLNHRDGNINVYGSYSYSKARNESYMNMYRVQVDTVFNQKSTMSSRFESHNFKAGLDYTLNSRNTIGFMVNGSLSDNTDGNYSRTAISYQPTGVLDKILVANNSTVGKRNNVNANLNYRYVDTVGREWTLDADHGQYTIRSNQLQPNYYYDPSGATLTDSNVYNLVAPTDINIYSLKSDYEQNFKKGRLGFGFKTSYVTSDNDFKQYDILPPGKELDTLNSNSFNYKENINAVYANYNRALKGWTIQGGLRVENTHAIGRSKGYKQTDDGYASYDSSFDRNYTDFFPSAALTYNKDPKKQWTLAYSRRIDRPAYQDLNPFEFKLDEYTFEKGNTSLKPQYTNSVGLTYLYKFKLTTTLNYSHVKDMFAQLLDTTDLSKSYITKQNLATQDIVSLNVSYPLQYKWYSVFSNLNAYYSSYKANFGPGREIDLDVYALVFYAQNNFRLGKEWTGEVTGFYTSPSIWQGTFKSKQMWSVDAGVQKTVMKGKATLKASVSDIFKTMTWKGTSNFAGQLNTANGGWESRLLKLNFIYRFGNTQVKPTRQHKTGSEDENKRVGSGGGAGMGNN